jgi:ATP-grasp domain
MFSGRDMVGLFLNDLQARNMGRECYDHTIRDHQDESTGNRQRSCRSSDPCRLVRDDRPGPRDDAGAIEEPAPADRLGGSQPRDMDSLKEVLLRFSALVEDLPGVDQMEINPLLVFNHGRGCAAVDVRALVKPTRPA